MEQTSSSAYPNVLVVDYVKKARVASPQLLMKAEQYLNVGYQTLLTFERPGGGFDWWGSGEPMVWLIPYGRKHLQDAKDNAYVLALAANALAAWDPKDDSTLEALRRLEKLKQEKP